MGDDPRNVTEEDLDFEKYSKRPVVIDAVQLDEPFIVDTLEGDNQHGDAGDYLVRGVEGERYPVAEDIFEKTYRPQEPEDPSSHGQELRRVPIRWEGDVAGETGDALIRSLREEGEIPEDAFAGLKYFHVEIQETSEVNGAVLFIDHERDEEDG